MIGPALPAGATAPTTELNTLADIIASCINSTGQTSSTDTTSNCGKLFAYTTPTGGTAPTDTVGALLNIAKNPGRNVSNLLTLVAPSAPFQPTLSQANDFTVSIKYKTGLGSNPTMVAIDQSGNLWVPNRGSGSVSELTAQGVPVSGSPYTNASLAQPAAVAIDAAGNAWVTNVSSNKVVAFTQSGTSSVGNLGTTTANTVPLNQPSGIAIDGQNILWITNNGNNTVSAVTVSGTTVTGSATYSGAGLNSPVAVAINPH